MKKQLMAILLFYNLTYAQGKNCTVEPVNSITSSNNIEKISKSAEENNKTHQMQLSQLTSNIQEIIKSIEAIFHNAKYEKTTHQDIKTIPNIGDIIKIQTYQGEINALVFINGQRSHGTVVYIGLDIAQAENLRNMKTQHKKIFENTVSVLAFKYRSIIANTLAPKTLQQFFNHQKQEIPYNLINAK